MLRRNWKKKTKLKLRRKMKIKLNKKEIERNRPNNCYWYLHCMFIVNNDDENKLISINTQELRIKKIRKTHTNKLHEKQIWGTK